MHTPAKKPDGNNYGAKKKVPVSPLRKVPAMPAKHMRPMK